MKNSWLKEKFSWNESMTEVYNRLENDGFDIQLSFGGKIDGVMFDGNFIELDTNQFSEIQNADLFALLVFSENED